jgi:hypothetical protein
MISCQPLRRPHFTPLVVSVSESAAAAPISRTMTHAGIGPLCVAGVGWAPMACHLMSADCDIRSGIP